MVGDDACSTFVELLKRILDIIVSMEESRKGAGKVKNQYPKIKYGKLSKQNFAKLQKAGTEFKFVTVPTDKLSDIEANVLKMGGSYFRTEIGESNNAVLAVPASQLDLLQTAMKYVVGKEMEKTPENIIVKDGSDLIPAEDIELVHKVLEKYDIPVISFKTSDDKYMNFVPKEFDGQYRKAIHEAEELKKETENIEVTRFDQIAPLDEPGFECFTVPEDEAKELYAAARSGNLDVSFVPYNDKVAVMYDPDIAEKVNDARQRYKASLEESEDFIIDIFDRQITLDMNQLNVKKLNTPDSYFMRVPNTQGQDYIMIGKSDSELINGGKTLKTELDPEKSYPVFDSEGKVKRAVNGSELLGYFNTKNRRINRNTAVYKYGTKGEELQRIDLYNSKKNELISVKMCSAEEMKIALSDRGLNDDTIAKLLADINKELDAEQREVFGYTAEKTEIAYADIPNIGEYLAQSQLSQTVIGKAERMGELPKNNGAKCCIYDKNTDKFGVIPVLPLKEVQSMLTQMGYSEISAKEIAEKVVRSYRDSDIEEEPLAYKTFSVAKEHSIIPQVFETSNAELGDMGFNILDGKIIIVKDDPENYKYMQIEQGTQLAEAEKAIRENFGIVDDISVSEVMKQMIDNDIIADVKTRETKEADVRQLSGNMIEVTGKETGLTRVMPMDNIDENALADLGISEKGVRDIRRSFEKNINEKRHPDKQTLGELKKFASEKIKEVTQAVKEKTPLIGKGQGR